MHLKDFNIDKSWTLFLDRDGVINKRIIDAYVLKWDDFIFLPKVLDAIKIFSGIFGKIIIVTNQQGIGKGLMSEVELNNIHQNMILEIENHGGRIDAVYFAPQIRETNHFDRKPNVGMALKAHKLFPEINFKKSIMAGDSISDMEFGHRLDMTNVFICNDVQLISKHHDIIQFSASDLFGFSEQLK